MLPSQLTAGHFKSYPPEARHLATSRLSLLQALPPAFVPLLLREIIAYDWKFPAERQSLEAQLAYLASLSDPQRRQALMGFAKLNLSSKLEQFDWVNLPAQFSEQLSAELWATHQIDAFHAAAVDYVQKVDMASPPAPLPVPRLGIVIVGQGVAKSAFPLFRKLRPQGAYFTQVKPEGGVKALLEVVTARATAHPVPFGHWYIEGGAHEPIDCAGLSSVAYQSLQPVRAALLKKMEKEIQSGTGGPEALRTMLAQLRPEEVGFTALNATSQVGPCAGGNEAVMNHFQLSVLTEGSGTQIFSTTFVQWAARELWRRAQPLTILVRYAPRQRERPMNEMIAAPRDGQLSLEMDPDGSLLDADMGAYLTRINQQRLAGAAQSTFLTWFENHSEAVAIGPTMPRGTVSDSPIDLTELLRQMA